MRFDNIDVDYWKFVQDAKVFDYRFYRINKDGVKEESILLNRTKYKGFNVFEPFYIAKDDIVIRVETKASEKSENGWQYGNLIGSLTVENGYSEDVMRELSDVVGKELTPS